MIVNCHVGLLYQVLEEKDHIPRKSSHKNFNDGVPWCGQSDDDDDALHACRFYHDYSSTILKRGGKCFI